MNFTNTDCVRYRVYLKMYLQMHVQVDNHVRRGLSWQMKRQMDEQINIYPIQIKIKQEKYDDIFRPNLYIQFSSFHNHKV